MCDYCALHSSCYHLTASVGERRQETRECRTKGRKLLFKVMLNTSIAIIIMTSMGQLIIRSSIPHTLRTLTLSMTDRQADRQLFGTKCSGCSQGILPTDLVRRARNKVFHLKCFTCLVCRKQLSTGEELYILDENRFVCKEDYMTSRHNQDIIDESVADCDQKMRALENRRFNAYNVLHIII
ncbi:unnamed protein product [Medioppia subpectinata]|uniref:LIM zinc-binding domain-containing protein n=1 Tax=Medioppia subpectinata TaxID=1979941 RepID=A0A7R9PX92_9ACAR|nr:unnamed protein product [Medioppia subpectinata]CAG2104580.1 unnamed protein product [Medioppia subpectinata]